MVINRVKGRKPIVRKSTHNYIGRKSKVNNVEINNVRGVSKMTLVDRPFVVRVEKVGEFLEMFNNMPSLSKEYIQECKNIAQQSKKNRKRNEN